MAKYSDEEFRRVIAAVRQVESGGNRHAYNPNSGAMGSMQTMPETLRKPGYGVKPATDNSPNEQERVGVDYLKAMLNKYATLPEALAAYNHGPGNVDKRGMGALPAETQNYISKVSKMAGMSPSFQADVRKSEPTALSVAAATPNPSIPPAQPPVASAEPVRGTQVSTAPETASAPPAAASAPPAAASAPPAAASAPPAAASVATAPAQVITPPAAQVPDFTAQIAKMREMYEREMYEPDRTKRTMELMANAAPKSQTEQLFDAMRKKQFQM